MAIELRQIMMATDRIASVKTQVNITLSCQCIHGKNTFFSFWSVEHHDKLFTAIVFSSWMFLVHWWRQGMKFWGEMAFFSWLSQSFHGILITLNDLFWCFYDFCHKIYFDPDVRSWWISRFIFEYHLPDLNIPHERIIDGTTKKSWNKNARHSE